IGDEINMKLSQPYYYNYTFKFENVSLLTGTNGYASYFKNESLIDNFNQIQQQYNEEITTINYGLLKNYYEEVFAPPARKTPVFLYNLKQQMIDSLPTYYAKVMQIFNIGDLDYVKKAIFQPLQISQILQDQIWNNQQFGWKSQKSLAEWVKIALSRQYQYHPNFQIIKKALKIEDDLMLKLSGKSSMLNKLAILINGTVSDSIYEYSQSVCMGGIFCTENELVSSQWASGILTTKRIFKHMKNPLNFSFHDLNSTIPKNAELGIYLEKGSLNANDGMQLLSVDQNTGDMLDPNDPAASVSIISYYNMAQFYNNKDNFGLINYNLKLYNIQKAKDLVTYIDYFEKNLVKKENLYPNIANEETTTLAWLIYKSFPKFLNKFSDFLLQSLYARSLYKQLQDIKCEKLFQEEILKDIGEKICKNKYFQQYDISANFENNFIFVQAFLGKQGSQIWNDLLLIFQITNDQLAFLLYNQEKSKYALLLNDIQNVLQKQYQCPIACSAYELGIQQILYGNIINNLPSKYFYKSDNADSLLEWDNDK
ncbi:hypothetical protein IMG5_007940, partial [Ichthyophthirius multifiliis]